MRKYSRQLSGVMLIIATSLVLSTSCTKDEILLNPEAQAPQHGDFQPQKETRDQRLMQDAINAYMLVQPSELRSVCPPPTVKSIDRLSSSRLRGLTTKEDTSNKDALAIVNFDNNAGFVIISEIQGEANEPIGIIPSGNLTSDSEVNPGLAIMLKNSAQYHISRIPSIARGEKEQMIGDDVDNPMKDIELRYDYPVYIYQVDPLIKARWAQGYPYNYMLDELDHWGNRPPVGCIATAVAQIMSYHKFPRKYDWESMIEDPSKNNIIIESIGSLFKDLGKPYNLNMTYRKDESSASGDNVNRTFRNYGYKSGSLQDYSWDDIQTEILENRPVYIQGVDITTTTTIENTFLFFKSKSKSFKHSGHAWVIDGIVYAKQFLRYWDKKTNQEKRSTLLHQKYVHCNWGWGKSGNNGFFASGVFTSKNPPRGLEDMEERARETLDLELRGSTYKEEKEGIEGYYKSHIKIVKGIQP